MDQFAWSKQVTTLSSMLDTLEAQVVDGKLGAPGLEELKSGLDTLRLRTWSLLTASNSDDPHGFQQRFRARRGTEMCSALSTDVRAGRLSGRQSELPDLGAAARELASAVKEVTQKVPKRRGKKSP